MKRLSEIVGKTPLFVRWTIGQECEMRDEFDGSKPLAIEKQLHAIKTAATAVQEQRVVDDIVIHPSAANPATTVDDALGFPLAEPFAAYGGQAVVSQVCQSCPACLPVNGQPIPANCYGWLILDLDDAELATQLNNASLSFDPSGLEIIDTQPKWHGIWLIRQPNPKQLSTIIKFVACINEKTRNSYQDWVIFAAAIERCSKHNLTLFMELVPAGDSDGVYWSVGPYCPECMHAQDETVKRCKICGRAGKPHPVKKRRSKGQRPYLRLKQLVGPEKTQRLLNKYRSSR